MITLIGIIIIGLASFGITELLPLPWYTPVIIAFLIGLITAKQKVLPFLLGFLGVGLFWLAKLIAPILSKSNALSLKMSSLFTESLGFTITPFILVIITILLGGLLGGLASYAGYLLLSPEAESPNLIRKGRSSRRSGTYKLKLN